MKWGVGGNKPELVTVGILLRERKQTGAGK